MKTNKSQRVLNWTEVLEARRKYEDPKVYATVRGLASEYGISKSSMYRLLKYKTYKQPQDEEV